MGYKVIMTYERLSEHSDKSTNRTVIRLKLVEQMDVFVFINKETKKRGKALKMRMSGPAFSKEDREVILYANNKTESDQLEDILKEWRLYHNNNGG